MFFFFFFSSRRRHTRFDCDWSSDVCSSDLAAQAQGEADEVIWLAVQLLGSAILVALGILAARRSEKLAAWLVAVCGTMIVFKVAISAVPAGEARLMPRSEERRVGKECRDRW